jgi:hypothetical protein
MYKRPARILYLGLPGDPRPKLAAGLTAEIGAGRMDGRGASVSDVDADTLAWPDLVVPLDAESLRRCPPLPPTARLRPWDLPDADGETARAIIHERIQSMLGGLRMLARLDENRNGQD